MKSRLPGSLQRRLMVWYAVLVVIPILVLSGFFIRSSYGSYGETVHYAAKSSFVQTKQLIDYYVSNVNEMINSILANEDFHKILEKDNTLVPVQDQVRDMLFLRKLLSTSSGRPEVDDIYLYLNNDAIYIGENAQTRRLEDARAEAWFDYVDNSYPNSVLIPGIYMGNSRQLGYAKAIREMRNYNVTAGIILFIMNKSLLTEYLGNSENSGAYIVNQSGDLIANSRESIPKLSLEELTSSKKEDGKVIRKDGSDWLLFTDVISPTGWFLVYLEPYVTIWDMLQERSAGYLLMLILILLTGLVFYYLIFTRFLWRITQLSRHMAGVGKPLSTLPETMPEGTHGDEIDELILSYNTMINRLEDLMKEQYRLGNQIRETELKALYEQINPHFLYNTLSMINWLAEDGQTEDVSRVITALSSFYRLSLNKGNENIYLKEELAIAENFVYIQKMRFGTEISLICDMDPIYDTFVLPKLTLQPLVENALVHGILKRRDKCGTIRIRVHEQGGNIVIEIQDNGIGIPEETLEKLNNGTIAGTGRHYGIWNVIQRASLYYGKPCTLHYESRQENGETVTTAVLRLPVVA